MSTTTTITNCRFCGMSHGMRCPSVKAIEYFEDGVTVKRVEFMSAADHYAPLSKLMWPDPKGPSWSGVANYGSSALSNACDQDEGA